MSSALKFVVALVAAVLTAVGPLLVGHPLGLVGQINVLVAGAGAVYVYLTTNHASGPWLYAKAWAHAISVVGVLVVSALAGGINPLEWMQIGIAALGTLGVLSVPNRSGRLA